MQPDNDAPERAAKRRSFCRRYWRWMRIKLKGSNMWKVLGWLFLICLLTPIVLETISLLFALLPYMVVLALLFGCIGFINHCIPRIW